MSGDAVLTPSRSWLRAFLTCRRHESLALLAWLRHYWLRVLLVLSIYAFGQHGLFVNWSSSLPYSVVWVDYGARPAKGDLVIFRFDKEPFTGERLQGLRFLKRVAGLPGETVSVQDGHVHVSGHAMGHLKRATRVGESLHVIAPGPIPAGYFYAQSDSADSFDSRYAECGLVRLDQVIGVAHAVF
jgi:conjugal transfer pilin signal peptidase TrbI